MNKIAGVYRIKSPSGAVYVGQSWNIHNRWRQYRSPRFLAANQQPKLAASFRKYGIDNHDFQIVGTLGPPPNNKQEHLNNLERFVLDEYKIEHFRILNIREAGSTGRPSPESIAKMVATRRANGSYVISEETREKYRKAQEGHKGTPHSEETKKRLSQLATGKRPSPEAREKNRQSQLGRKHSAETKAKIAAAHIGRKRPDLSARNACGISAESRKKIWETRRRNANRVRWEQGALFQ